MAVENRIGGGRHREGFHTRRCSGESQGEFDVGFATNQTTTDQNLPAGPRGPLRGYAHSLLGTGRHHQQRRLLQNRAMEPTAGALATLRLPAHRLQPQLARGGALQCDIPLRGDLPGVLASFRELLLGGVDPAFRFLET